MDEALRDNCVFQARYGVAWPIWAGGYPTQEQALAAATAYTGELTSLLETSLRAVTAEPLALERSWSVGGYQAIDDLYPSLHAPNSLVLTITVLVVPYDSADSLNETSAAAAAQNFVGVISDWAKLRMPGAARGANIYDVVLGWRSGPALLTAGEPVLDPDLSAPTATPAPVPLTAATLAPRGWAGTRQINRQDSYRHRLTLGQLRQIASSRRNGGEDVLDTYYGWRNERAVSVMKGVGGAALSLFSAWLIPFLKDEYASTPPWLVLGPPLFVIVALAVWSMVVVIRLDRLHASYAAAAALLQTLRP